MGSNGVLKSPTMCLRKIDDTSGAGDRLCMPAVMTIRDRGEIQKVREFD
uniref:Uncharacterized protein n=1 Tax=Rhizophora mucronata TaxID=61149 RepID=A0A2P2K6G2_RHIMU